MRKYYLITLLFIATIYSFSSCEVINPSEEIPCYLRIDSITFVDSAQSPPVIVSRKTQRIIDAWVFIDGKLIGIYEYPFTIPVILSDGTHRVRVYAGISRNGTASDKEIYPFFTRFDQVVDFKKGETDTVKPRFAYDYSIMKFPPEAVGQFPEGFEGAGTIFKMIKNGGVDTLLKEDNDSLVFNGNYSGLLVMNATAPKLTMETSKAYSVPTNRRPVYFEMSFKTDVTLRLGIYGINNATSGVTDVPFINLNPTNGEWKKVYLNFTDEVSSFTNTKFKIYLKADHNTTLPESKILLDDIQLIYQ